MTQNHIETKNRILWIDYAKVLGIFLVIFAHLYTSEGTSSTNIVRTYIYGFHMPFFFLISGCLYKVREGGLKQAILLNIKKLLIPYLCLNVFFAIVWGIIYANPIEQFIKIPYGIISGRGTPCGASWFIIALFFIKCLYDFLSYKKIEKIVIPVILVLTIMLHFLSVNHNFFYFKSVLIGICFFHLGRLSFDFLNRIKVNTLIYLIVSVALFIASYYITILNGKVSLFGGSMGNNFLLFYANAIVGSLGIISISFCASKIQSNTICKMSNASIAVVLLHMIFVEGTRIAAKHFEVSGLQMFVVYAVSSVIIYLICFALFEITNKKNPYIWGK